MNFAYNQQRTTHNVLSYNVFFKTRCYNVINSLHISLNKWGGVIKKIVLIVLFLGIALSALSIGWGLGVKIHGHIEPFVMASVEIGVIDVMFKTGFIFGENIVDLVVPGIFAAYDFFNFRVYGGFEGLWHLTERECLVLGRVGLNYGFDINFSTLYVGGELELPVNLPGEFFVDTDGLSIIPALITYLEF